MIKDSSTIPVCIVYDYSCHQSSTSPSLNDYLTAGAPLKNDMCAILIQFRIYNFAFSADLEKALLHIQLDEEVCDFISFLWPTDPKDPASQFQAYRFTVIPFGLMSSPFILNATVLHHLDQYETDVSQDMQDNLYVDNVFSGCDTEDEAISYYHEARSHTRLDSSKHNTTFWDRVTTIH